MMPQLIGAGLNEDKIWLNVVDIDGMLRVVDQNGREVGGCVNFSVNVDTESLTSISMTVSAAYRDNKGKIQFKLRG